MGFQIIENIIKNNSIVFHDSAKDWKEAVYFSIEPLIKNNVCTLEYYESIIESTQKYGPYYILCPLVAMPHGEIGKGVLENGVSICILNNGVIFGENQEIKILVCLCAKDATIHTAVALPQIAALFEQTENVEKIMSLKTKIEVLDFLKSLDLSKYL